MVYMERLLNVPLLRKSLEFVTEHPEEWDQTTFGAVRSCGTVGCFAHHAVRLDGAKMVGVQYARFEEGDDPDYLISIAGVPTTHVRHRAQRVLGLPDGHRLFDSDNTLLDLEVMVNRLIREAESGE